MRGGVSEVPGIAESAILQNSFTFYINTNKSGRSDSVLLFRTSNLLGEVVWHRDDVPASRAADKETAVPAPRQVPAARAR